MYKIWVTIIFIMQMKEQSPANKVLQITKVSLLIMIRIVKIDVAIQC
jgi:hypothetical protein